MFLLFLKYFFYVNLNVLTLSFVVEQHPVLVLWPIGCANVAKGCLRLLTFLLAAISQAVVLFNIAPVYDFITPSETVMNLQPRD